VNSLIEAALLDPHQISIYDAWSTNANKRLFSGFNLNHPSSVYIEYARLLSYLSHVGEHRFPLLMKEIEGIAPHISFHQTIFTWIHGDCKGANYLEDLDGKIHIIDGERARFADLAMDFGEFLDSLIRAGASGAVVNQVASLIRSRYNNEIVNRSFLWFFVRMCCLYMFQSRSGDIINRDKAGAFAEKAREFFIATSR